MTRRLATPLLPRRQFLVLCGCQCAAWALAPELLAQSVVVEPAVETTPVPLVQRCDATEPVKGMLRGDRGRIAAAPQLRRQSPLPHPTVR